MKILLVLPLILALASVTLTQEDVVYEEQMIEIDEPIATEQSPAIRAESIPLPPRQPFKLDLQTLQRFRNEVLGVAFIFVYLVLYVRGKKANVEIMQKFYRKVDVFLQNNFAHVGFSKQSGEVPFNGESPSESVYYATGRDNVEYIEMRFNKRQDLIYSLYDIVFPERDTVTIDVPVKTDVPLVFLIAQKKRVKELSEQYLDIRKITGKFNVGNLSAGYEVLGESAETVDSIVDNYIVKRLNDMSGVFFSIHYTDLKTFSNRSGHLRVVLNATHKNPEHFLPAMELIFYLVDKLASYKLTANSKARAQKARQAYNQSKEKEELQKHNEDLRKKKEDKLRQEDAWLRSLPPDRQKKEEEKRKKKEFNKLMKGKTMKM